MARKPSKAVAPPVLPPDEAVSLFYNGHRIANIANPPSKWIAMNRTSGGEAVLVTPLPPGMEERLRDSQFYLVEGDIDWPGEGGPGPEILTFYNLDNPPFYFTKPNKMTVPLDFNKGTRQYGYVQSRVYCRDHDGNNVTIPGASLSWRTTDAAIATSTDEDSPNGVIEFRGLGTATVTCRCDTFQSEWGCEFTVVAAPPPEQPDANPLIADIQIDAEPDAPAVGATTALTAHLYDAAGAAITDPGLLVWTTTDVSHITVAVDPANLAKATATIVADGGAQVICTSPAGSSGSIKINIVKDEGGPATTAAILVDPTDPIRMLAGDGVLMGMHFADGQGNEAPAPGDVTWASSDETIVTLTPSGPPGVDGVTATAVKEGTAVITGSVADPALSATIDMDVLTRAATVPPPSTITGMSFTISGWPDTPVGETNSVTAAFKNGSNPAPWVSEPQWISSKPAVFAITGASHTETGSTVNLSAVGPGATSIICIVDGYQGPPVDLTVRAAEAEPEAKPGRR